MNLFKLERFIEKTPFIGEYYTRNYGKINRRFYSLNRIIPFVETPLFVHWHATYGCNLACAHCGAKAGIKGDNELNTQEICRAVRDMGKMGVRRFIVTGGEPLLREDIFEVFSEAERSGVKRLTLATNGLLVNKYRNDLKNAGLYTVHVSIDGPREMNDRFRGKEGAFRKAWGALFFFKDIGVKEIVINTLVHKDNLRALPDFFYNQVLHSPATLWNIQPPLAVGRSENNPRMRLGKDEITFLFKFMLEARKKFPVQIAKHIGFLGPLEPFFRSRRFFCGAGLENCAILAEGDVIGCQVLYDKSHSMGNIKEESFRSIWKKNYGNFKVPVVPDECRNCIYYSSCLGSCAALWQIEGRCFKEIFESEEFRERYG